MTTKPSIAPWADEPFRLIALPANHQDSSIGHVYCASEMTHVHNTIIRSLNAILQQAPHVPVATDDNYVAQDVKDLLFYVQSWVKMVNHHHSVEESFMFPELEKFSGIAGLMDDPKHQHELFHDGLGQLLTYALTTQPDDYRWKGPSGMEALINSFSKALTDHLYAEIDVFMGMKHLDSAGLLQTWEETEKVAKDSGNIGMLYDIFPVVLGSADKTFNGGNSFPPLPFVMPYVIKYWFAAGNGAWRFNPCDWWGRPRPLAFAPTGSQE
ncbi:hypothetical protein HJFPF1_09504 [Paramyrothecium foliicola]|nr:hypothetical protein HJFPF1_09504 [Paramyrothecium foliicola]